MIKLFLTLLLFLGSATTPTALPYECYGYDYDTEVEPAIKAHVWKPVAHYVDGNETVVTYYTNHRTFVTVRYQNV